MLLNLNWSIKIKDPQNCCNFREFRRKYCGLVGLTARSFNVDLLCFTLFSVLYMLSRRWRLMLNLTKSFIMRSSLQTRLNTQFQTFLSTLGFVRKSSGCEHSSQHCSDLLVVRGSQSEETRIILTCESCKAALAKRRNKMRAANEANR